MILIKEAMCLYKESQIIITGIYPGHFQGLPEEPSLGWIGELGG